jgi:hypothetical protein
MRLHLVHRPAVVEADERLERDLPQGRHALERGERRTGGHDEHVRVVQQLASLVGPGVERERPEGQVELPALDHVQELALVGGLAQDDLDRRVLRREPPQELRQDARAHALEGADAEPSEVAGLQRAHVRLRGEQAGLDRVGVAQEHRPRLGERDRPRPAGALDQAQADDPLERGDLLRDRGLRVPEPLGRPPERALVRDRLQGDQMAEVEPVPAIRLHDRTVAAHQQS